MTNKDNQGRVNGVSERLDIDVDLHLDCSVSGHDDAYGDLGLGEDVPPIKPVVRRKLDKMVPVRLPCRVKFKDVEVTRWEDVDFEVEPL